MGRIAGEVEPPRALLVEPAAAWGGSWPAGPKLLAAVAYHATRVDGPILECGSGLTTAVLAVLAAKTSRPVWTLEHLPHWGEQTQRVLGRLGCDSVVLHVVPLCNYGSFDWYDPPRDVMPNDFALVMCDGPPGRTRGGRRGLLPFPGTCLDPGYVVLLDDPARPREACVVEAWSLRLAVPYRVYGVEKPFAVLRLPDDERCQEPFLDRWLAS